jgi:hypothetical protein
MDIVHTANRSPAALALGDQARAFAKAAFAANTRRAFAAQWRLWLAHCEASGQPSLPVAPEAVAD